MTGRRPGLVSAAGEHISLYLPARRSSEFIRPPLSQAGGMTSSLGTRIREERTCSSMRPRLVLRNC